ncbi:MAG TPA: S1C family serine protease [Stellaceae bacterium]|nr:S1C family serine protease [Stellaceae bacterium]
MAEAEWELPPQAQPNPKDYGYDLERALTSVVGVRATVPEDAFTAQTLGTERAGNGVVIREDGIILTIGYLITEAESLWLNTGDGRALPGHVVAYDQETGFGLVQALGRLSLPALPIGQSAKTHVDDDVVVGGAGGRSRSLAARIAAKQEFAGYWEYLLDEALFTLPAHPNWGGTAVIDTAGRLIGIGSLHLQQAREHGRTEHLNMNVPIDLLKPIYDDLLTLGRPNKPPRPWLGLYATEIEDRVVVAGLSNDGPARQAGMRVGDILVSIAGQEVGTLAALYRRLWSLGRAGVEVPLTLQRDGRTLTVTPRSADRSALLKKARLQ